MDNRPIGVLDSGLGGLTVLKKVIEKMPNESTIFIGDQANAIWRSLKRRNYFFNSR